MVEGVKGGEKEEGIGVGMKDGYLEKERKRVEEKEGREIVVLDEEGFLLRKGKEEKREKSKRRRKASVAQW